MLTQYYEQEEQEADKAVEEEAEVEGEEAKVEGEKAEGGKSDEGGEEEEGEKETISEKESEREKLRSSLLDVFCAAAVCGLDQVMELLLSFDDVARKEMLMRKGKGKGRKNLSLVAAQNRGEFLFCLSVSFSSFPYFSHFLSFQILFHTFRWHDALDARSKNGSVCAG